MGIMVRASGISRSDLKLSTSKDQRVKSDVYLRSSLISSTRNPPKMPVPVGANMGGPSTFDKRMFASYARESALKLGGIY